MLSEVLHDLPCALDVCPARLGASETSALVRTGGYRIVCIADLPPSAPSKTRYLVRKLRAAIPDLTILVGRWAPASLLDDSAQPLLEAGATHVASSLLETRDQLRKLVALVPGAAPAVVAGAPAAP